MKALVDGDLIAYRSAASAENEDDALPALMRADSLVQQVLTSIDATGHSLFLTGRNNFRKKLDPEYKANRKDSVPPRWLNDVRGFLINHWKAEVTEGYEADDALGVNQTSETCICSLDKDLLQVPGWHFNWMHGTLQEITNDTGLLNFYTQSLTGDRADNVTGIRGIGPVKASKILGGLNSSEYYDACRDLYQDDERYHRNLKLLWVWRKLNDEPPIPLCNKNQRENSEVYSGEHSKLVGSTECSSGGGGQSHCGLDTE